MRMADRIVTVSEASRRDIAAWSGVPADRIRVITEGPDPVFRTRGRDSDGAAVLARIGIAPESRFLLYVGGLSPHKNLLRLVEAFAEGAPPDVKLMLVGDVQDVFHTHVPQIREAIAQHELRERVILAGFVPDAELVQLYRRAYALILPSLLEGFGLPAVEAMACGTPVLSSNAGSLPEVVGEAGIYFEPTDVDSIAGAIRLFLAAPAFRDELARLARAALGSLHLGRIGPEAGCLFRRAGRQAERKIGPGRPQDALPGAGASAVTSCPRARCPIISVTFELRTCAGTRIALFLSIRLQGYRHHERASNSIPDHRRRGDCCVLALRIRKGRPGPGKDGVSHSGNDRAPRSAVRQAGAAGCAG